MQCMGSVFPRHMRGAHRMTLQELIAMKQPCPNEAKAPGKFCPAHDDGDED